VRPVAAAAVRAVRPANRRRDIVDGEVSKVTDAP